jgi:uncharacterized protein (DUF924 family)
MSAEPWQEILDFWFSELESKQWWIKDEKLDRDIEFRFGVLHKKSIAGELSDWRAEPSGRLAEIIILDQFSRSIYRDRPESFAYDSMAWCWLRKPSELGRTLPLKCRNRRFSSCLHA